MEQEREIALTARGLRVGERLEHTDEGLSFSVLKKGIHGILAPDGSGKGELLRLLAGIREGEGSVEIGGEIMTPENTALRAKVAYVPARAFLAGDMTVRETLEFVGEAKGVGAELLPRQIKEAEALLGLDSVGKRLVRRLTEAERWRLTMAMALLGNPDLLLVEEPMRSLGEESESARRELLTMLGGVKTVILATASYSLAKAVCEDVILLSDGVLLAAGSFEELESRLAENGAGETLEELYLRLSSAANGRREEVAE